MQGRKGFQKGVITNPKGRPKGTKNKITADLRQSITDFLEDRFGEVVQTWVKLSDKDKLTFYRDLLQYAIPRLQNTELKGNPIETKEPIIINVSSQENAKELKDFLEDVSKLKN